MTDRLASRYSAAVTARPGTKLVSRLSAPVEAAVLSGRKHFKVFRAYEGKQIVINWGVSVAGIIEVKLVRKLDNWAESIVDGTLLVSDSLPWTLDAYSDHTDIDIYRVYYYTLFMLRQDGVWIYDKTMRGKIFALPTGYFEEALWTRLPTVYQRVDGEA